MGYGTCRRAVNDSACRWRSRHRGVPPMSCSNLGIPQQPPQSGVLAFEFLESAGVRGLHSAELVAPPVIAGLENGHSRCAGAVSLSAASSRSPVTRLRRPVRDRATSSLP